MNPAFFCVATLVLKCLLFSGSLMAWASFHIGRPEVCFQAISVSFGAGIAIAWELVTHIIGPTDYDLRRGWSRSILCLNRPLGDSDTGWMECGNASLRVLDHLGITNSRQHSKSSTCVSKFSVVIFPLLPLPKSGFSGFSLKLPEGGGEESCF